MQDKVSQDHVFDATGLHLVPEFYTEWYVENMMKKAAGDDPWELAGKIIDEGTGHDAFKVLSQKWDKVVQALGEAKKESDGLRGAGAGNTEDPDILGRRVIPAMQDYADTMDAVIKQLKARVVEQSKHRL
jgi:hypothetical protein